MAEKFENIDLLLIGKTGHGKSATGNSILGRKVFKSEGSMTSVTKGYDFDVSKMDNRVIRVVDVQGVCDTDETEDAGLTEMLENAIALHPIGYHALLLIFKYSERFTKEEINAVTFLKKKLGSDFVKNHAIVVLTNGDTFERDEKSKSYEVWCREQTGPFRELLDECNSRSVLFNNHTKDANVLTAQRKALLDIIDTKLQGKRYDHEIFKFAQKMQASVTKEAGKPIATGEMVDSCSLILQSVEDVLDSPEEKRFDDRLSDILVETKDLQQKVTEEDNRSGSLIEIINLITLVQQCIMEERQNKKAKSKKKKGAISELVKSIPHPQLVKSIPHPQLDSSKRMVLRQSFKKIKNDYHNNNTEKVVGKIHGKI